MSEWRQQSGGDSDTLFVKSAASFKDVHIDRPTKMPPMKSAPTMRGLYWRSQCFSWVVQMIRGNKEASMVSGPCGSFINVIRLGLCSCIRILMHHLISLSLGGIDITAFLLCTAMVDIGTGWCTDHPTGLS